MIWLLNKIAYRGAEKRNKVRVGVIYLDDLGLHRDWGISKQGNPKIRSKS